MAKDPEITKVIAEAQRVILMALQRQVPVAKVNGGSLKKSLGVRGYETKTGNIAFQYDYLEYGIYLDWGTGTEGKYPRRGPFNPSPKVGNGGIVPRFWTSLPDATKVNVSAIVARATQKILSITFKRQKLQ